MKISNLQNSVKKLMQKCFMRLTSEVPKEVTCRAVLAMANLIWAVVQCTKFSKNLGEFSSFAMAVSMPCSYPLMI